ncbi:MAG: hypothetical protein ACT4OX_14175 [Actinomycetota bacterium]
MTTHLTPDDADRILSGAAPDSPLGEALARVARLATGAAPDAGFVVPQMAAAVASGGSGVLGYAWLFRPRGIVAAKLLATVTATATVATGGLAATDNLPAPIQDAVANVVDVVGIDIPGGADPVTDTPEPNGVIGVATTTTTSTTTTTTTTTTTPVTTAPTSAPEGPGRCAALDADIVDGSAIGTPPGPGDEDGALAMVVHTTGQVDEVSALIAGEGGTALEETAPGTWSATIPLPGGGPERVGEMMLFTALGCGFDELEVNMTVTTGP